MREKTSPCMQMDPRKKPETRRGRALSTQKKKQRKRIRGHRAFFLQGRRAQEAFAW